MNPKPTQSKSIRAQLLSAMRDGEYAHCDRLPRESVLSEKLGISRTQLRDILASLDREGFITRRHGVGTIINRHVLGAQARICLLYTSHVYRIYRCYGGLHVGDSLQQRAPMV